MCTSPYPATREVIMPTVKQLGVIAIAIAAAIVGAGAVGISAIEHSATQVPANRFTPSKADFRLNDHQRLRKILLGQEHIELPLR
jgi:hypothetical protein